LSAGRVKQVLRDAVVVKWRPIAARRGGDYGGRSSSNSGGGSKKERIVATAAWGVIELEPDQFLLALALEAEPLVVRSAVTSFWGNSHRRYRYLAAVKGAQIFCESVPELALHAGAILVEAKQIKIPSDM
jgi:hypothetical protein